MVQQLTYWVSLGGGAQEVKRVEKKERLHPYLGAWRKISMVSTLQDDESFVAAVTAAIGDTQNPQRLAGIHDADGHVLAGGWAEFDVARQQWSFWPDNVLAFNQLPSQAGMLRVLTPTVELRVRGWERHTPTCGHWYVTLED